MKYLIPLMFLCLAGCISDQTQTPSVTPAAYPDIATIKAERDATSRTYVLCLMRNAKALDDRRSEPGSIATGVLAACGAEFDANVDAHSRYLPDGLEGRQKVATAARQAAYGTATEFVLKNRNGTLKIPN